MREYSTSADDSLDAICMTMDGNTGSIEVVLSLNPKLAQHDIGCLPAGLTIIFPDLEAAAEVIEAPSVSLWD